MYIPIPEGVQLPPNANIKPFKLDGIFIAIGNSLMPLQLGGKPVMLEKDAGEDPEHEAQEGPAYEASESEGHEGGEGECCSTCGGSGKMDGMEGMEDMGDMGDMGDSKHKGNSFVIAIERSMKRK